MLSVTCESAGKFPVNGGDTAKGIIGVAVDGTKDSAAGARAQLTVCRAALPPIQLRKAPQKFRPSPRASVALNVLVKSVIQANSQDVVAEFDVEIRPGA